MGNKGVWATFVGAINAEYERRVRAASNVREYQIGGHGHHHGHDAHDEHIPEERPGDPHLAYGTDMEPANVDPPPSATLH